MVVPVDPERGAVSLPGWRNVPLGSNRFQLVVNGELIDERATELRRIEDLIPALREAEAILGAEDENRAERSLRAAFGERAFPAVLDESGALLLPTGEVAVGFETDITEDTALAVLTGYGAKILRRLPLSAPSWLITVPEEDGIALALSLAGEPGVRFASPNFIEEVPERRAEAPPNALFTEQWHLENTGQGGGLPGADINARAAWCITRGSPEIIVCIIDSGVELAHPSFSAPGKIVAPFDAADGDDVPAPTVSSHGTSCAGVAVAGWGTGDVVGVAPNCRLMPIRRADISEHVRMAEAFSWAWQQGADVISCSFGYDGRPWILPDVVRAAMEEAITLGRQGRGAVIVWAAGNGNEAVSDDEWASHPETLAVAASTDSDRRAGYSDFGPEIDVCAPSSGGFRSITTSSNGGYTSFFGGTSSAAPLVAGVAALMLSVCPSLTGAEVRAILRSTALQIDFEEGEYDNTGHSRFYGYGRVDAARALEGISPLIEALRDSPALADIEQIDAFTAAYLASSSAGQAIISFLSTRRFIILALLKSDIAFRQRAQTVLETIIQFMKGGEHPGDITDAAVLALTGAAQDLIDASISS